MDFRRIGDFFTDLVLSFNFLSCVLGDFVLNASFLFCIFNLLFVGHTKTSTACLYPFVLFSCMFLTCLYSFGSQGKKRTVS